MKEKMLTDVNDKLSAKRVWAGRYLWLGIVMPIIWFLLKMASGIFHFEFEIKFPLDIWFGILGLGGGLLGFTIFETKNK